MAQIDTNIYNALLALNGGVPIFVVLDANTELLEHIYSKFVGSK
jgi:hypothetical protein